MDNNKEIKQLAGSLQEAFSGDPWYGKPLTALLAETDEDLVFQKPSGEHSLLELLWHIVTWKEFTVSRLQPGTYGDTDRFKELDWRPLDHSDKSLWQKGLQHLTEVHDGLVNLLAQQTDDLLEQPVADRSFNFRYLLNGIIQHDIYHVGQIAYLTKLLKRRSETNQ